MINITQSLAAEPSADALREARPTSAFLCAGAPGDDDRRVHITAGKLADPHWWQSLQSSDEGYEPEGPNGPTYYRIGHNSCLSTIFRDNEFYLIVTMSPEEDIYVAGARSEVAVRDTWDRLLDELASTEAVVEVRFI